MIKHAISSFVAMIFMTSFTLYAQTNLVKSPNNPVLDAGPVGSWDAWAVHSASVLKEGTVYKMWYSGADGTPWTYGVGYATSPDGKQWSKYDGNPVLRKGISGQWDAAFVMDPSVLYVNGQYMMWYSGGTTADRHKIGLATSSDGIHWVKYSGNPVLTNGPAGSWDSKHVYRPSVYYDGSVFHMWYEGTKLGGDSKIGYATSPDGKTWQKHANNPVLSNGLPGSWESRHVSQPAVIWDGSQYVMYYGGSNGSHWLVGAAFSIDGIHWQKNVDNPVLNIGAVGEWDDEHVFPGFAIFDEGVYRFWYDGNRDGTHSKIGYAEESMPEPLEFSEIRIVWQLATPASGDHGFANVERIGRKIYLPGGGNQYDYSNPVLSIYDSDTDSWSFGANMPTPKAGNSATTVLNGKFYHIGGEGPYAGRWSPELEAYDPASNTWALKQNWPSPRRDIGVAAAKGKIFVLGGQPNYFHLSSDLDIYDPVSDSWSKGSKFPTNISGATVIEYNDKLYVFGGYSGSNQSSSLQTDKVYLFDPISNIWQEKARMPYPRARASAGVYRDKIYLIGGERNNKSFSQEPFEDVWEYSPDEDKFRLVESENFVLAHGNGLHAVVIDDEIFYVGTHVIGADSQNFDFEPTLQRGKFIYPNNAPVANAGSYDPYECSSPNGTEVTLDGSGSTDPDGDPLTYTWRENGKIIAGPTSDATILVSLSLGRHTLELTVDDGKDGIDTDETVIEVVDTTPPVMTVMPSTSLWPPNHKYHTIEIEDIVESISDLCAGDLAVTESFITSASSDEPEDAPGNGDGKTTDDIVIADDCRSIQLRAERKGDGNGRVYTINVAVNDVSGNVGTAAYLVTVPHDYGKGGGAAADDGTAYTVKSVCEASPVMKFADSYKENANFSSDNFRVRTDDTLTGFLLHPNHPNPFNPVTVIRYEIPATVYVRLDILDITGKLVTTLVNLRQQPGAYRVTWDGRDQVGTVSPSGTYICRMQAGRKFVATRKMVFIR